MSPWYSIQINIQEMKRVHAQVVRGFPPKMFLPMLMYPMLKLLPWFEAGECMVNYGTLWLFNIAMVVRWPIEINDFPLQTSIYKGFSMAMLVITRW